MRLASAKHFLRIKRGVVNNDIQDRRQECQGAKNAKKNSTSDVCSRTYSRLAPSFTYSCLPLPCTHGRGLGVRAVDEVRRPQNRPFPSLRYREDGKIAPSHKETRPMIFRHLILILIFSVVGSTPSLRGRYAPLVRSAASGSWTSPPPGPGDKFRRPEAGGTDPCWAHRPLRSECRRSDPRYFHCRNAAVFRRIATRGSTSG